MIHIIVIDTHGIKRDLNAQEGQSLMEALREAPFTQIIGRCGGVLSCATCHVYIHPDWHNKLEEQDNEKSEQESDMIDALRHKSPSSRLSCQIRIDPCLDGLIIALPRADFHWDG